MLTVTSQWRQRQQLAQDEYGDEAEADLRVKGSPPIPIDYKEKMDAALDYLQASKARKITYVETERDSETDDGWSVSGAQV
jgi:hypothetical protein